MEYNIGAIVEGRVTKLTPYGAFFGFEDGRSGLLHISEVADGFVRDVGEYLTVGDTVKVKIIAIDEKGKLSLSRKQAMADEKRTEPPPAYTPTASEGSDFEAMMSKFMSASNEKLSSLKERGDVQPKRRRTR